MITAEGCLFCGIVAGAIPATIVYEDQDIVAFLDIKPAAPVHVLVVPRDHYPNVAALREGSAECVVAVIAAATTIAEQHEVADGWRLVFNTGERGGQTVFHCHAHVLGYPA